MQQQITNTQPYYVKPKSATDNFLNFYEDSGGTADPTLENQVEEISQARAHLNLLLGEIKGLEAPMLGLSKTIADKYRTPGKAERECRDWDKYYFRSQALQDEYDTLASAYGIAPLRRTQPNYTQPPIQMIAKEKPLATNPLSPTSLSSSSTTPPQQLKLWDLFETKGVA